MLKLNNVTKQYKAGKPVFSGITKTFKPGMGVGLIGANGSGKTTFLRILSINSFPTSGRVTYDGDDIHAAPAAYLQHVGLVHDEETLPQHLTAVEFLEWVLRSRKLWNDDSATEINHLFDELSLMDREELIGTYSTGMKKKTQIAAAIIVKPEILILDEPLRGLDLTTRERVSQLIFQAKKMNTLILMASHSVDPDSELFDEVLEFPLT